MEHITCQLCGEKVHSIQRHLTKSHGVESSEACSFEEYKSRFPDAPILSDRAKKLLEEKRGELAPAASTPLAVSKEGKAEFHKVFELGRTKAARKPSGDPILINMSQQTTHEEMIPKIDNNYVFDIDVLKTILMGIETNIPTYLYGHAGVGKSTIWEQLCARTNRRMIRVPHTGQTEEAQIVGQWTVKKHKDETSGNIVSETVFELGPLPLAMINGWVYLADEYDRAYPHVLSVYQAVLEGKSLLIKEADEENRIIEPHPDFRFVATGNSNGSGDESGLYQATVIQDAATFERFGIVQRIDYMPQKQEAAIVRAQARVSQDDADAIIEFCKSIRKEYPSHISLTLGPRVAINIANIGVMRDDYKKGVEVAFANRLPESEREATMKIAQRIFG